MKKVAFILFALLFIAGTADVRAQILKKAALKSIGGTQDHTSKKADDTVVPTINNAFEGEIVYETYENYSEYILKMPNSICFNGVHKIRLIVKGGKMHVIDETTSCHTISDDNNKVFTHYCDHTKKGMDYSKNIESQLMLKPSDITYNNFTSRVKSNTFAKKEKTTTILDHECALYEGRMVRDMSMEQTYDIKAYVSSDIPAPTGYNYNLYGLDIPNIALKWILKYDGGHVGYGVGELSYYIEADVIEINPRAVNDDEFVVPSNYKISKSSSNPFSLMKYYKGVKKALVELGIKGEDQSQKTTGVHYKTNGKWDF